MKQIEEIDKEFTEYLWQMPHHWFTDVHNGIRVMDPICYALYQAFCFHYGYEFGAFDLASKEERKVTGYVPKNYKKPMSEENRKLVTFSLGCGQHKDDWKILLPIFKREKEKYLHIMKIKSLMLERARKIKSEEDNFKSKEWDNINFARTDAGPGEKPKHVSDIVPENLSEEDFVRYFEYIVLMRADIVTARVNKTYFSK